MNAIDFITELKLQPHPEGGFYALTYKSDGQIPHEVLPDGFSGNRVFSTAIYFLLSGKDFSAFHRIQSDELWHFYAGCGLEIFVNYPNGESEVLKLGSDLNNGFRFQQLVPAGCWFASKPVDENCFSLVGCTVAPGFDFAEFELAEKEQLLSVYPQHSDWIRQLCR
ncbi:MAG: cupin domain-containing protein [Chitinophagaceae bacterium]